jgi:hypothetical protein
MRVPHPSARKSQAAAGFRIPAAAAARRGDSSARTPTVAIIILTAPSGDLG